MKKSLNLNGAKILKIAVVLLIMTMITGILVSNTVAKYTTSFTGSDTARVAEFSVSATGITAGAVDLFATSYGSTSKVTSSDTDNVVAPGTAGSISISFTNNSEVPIALSGATLSETNEGSIPIVYSVDNVTYYAAEDSTLNSALSSAISGTLAAGASMPVVVYWKWVFYVDESGDAADTALGLAGTAEVTTTVAVTATQVASA